MRPNNAYDKNIIRSLRAKGCSLREITAKTGVPKSTVARFLDSDGATPSTKPAGRPRLLSEKTKRAVVRRFEAGNLKTSTDGRKYLMENTNLIVSNRTIIRALSGSGLCSYVRPLKPRLEKIHKINRYRWARAMKPLDQDFWDNVIFTDESKYNLYGPDGNKRVWRRSGSPSLDHHFRQVVKFGGGNVKVWGAITSRGVGKLTILDGNMDANMFIDILGTGLAWTLDKRNFNIDGVYLQMDNDPKHTSSATKEWLMSHNIACLNWPSCSPDMNIIEHVWNDVNVRLRDRDPQPRNMGELRVAIDEEWYKTDPLYIRKLYDSIPTRVMALFGVKGGFTKY